MTAGPAHRLGLWTLAALVCCGFLAAGGGAALAQAAVEDDAVSATLRDIVAGEEPGEGTVPQAESTAEAAVIDGFRSAKFGMTEAQVLQAIQDDFGIAEADVSRDHNRLERTDSLAIRIEDLIPESGPAAVVYVLGYSSDQLIQVSVLWGRPVSEEYDPATLLQTANALQHYFIGRRYAPDSSFANILLEDGTLIVFTGSDEEGRQVTLSLMSDVAAASEGEETPEEGTEGAQPVLQPRALRLSYVADPSDPDIFRIAPGSF